MSAKLGSTMPWPGTDGAEDAGGTALGVGCGSLFDPQGSQSLMAASPRAQTAMKTATNTATHNFVYDLPDCRTELFKMSSPWF
jgi:hypothetical protein